jgi:hypothetical protein
MQLVWHKFLFPIVGITNFHAFYVINASVPQIRIAQTELQIKKVISWQRLHFCKQKIISECKTTEWTINFV